MKEFVFFSERGNDKNSGLSDDLPVRTAKKAIAIANRTGRDIRVLGSREVMKRLTFELESARQKKGSS
jgi:hypothetical protein